MNIVLDEELLNTGRVYGLDDEDEEKEKDFDGAGVTLDDDLLPDALGGDLLGDTEEDDPFSSSGDFEGDEEDEE